MKELREERELTQETLASKAGLTVSSLSRIERGVTSPRWATVAKITDAMEVTLNELTQRIPVSAVLEAE